MATSRRISNCSTPCMVSKWVIAVLLFLLSVAALIGTYNTHVIAGGVEFGSPAGSFAIIAFVVAVTAWGKQMVGCLKGTCDACDA